MTGIEESAHQSSSDDKKASSDLRECYKRATNTMLPTTCTLHKHNYVAAKHKEQDNNAEDKQNAAADQNVIIVTTVICI